MPQVSKSENLQEVGRKIRHYREKKKMSQLELAEAIGVTQNTIYLIETAQSEMKLEKLFRIAEVLDVTPNKLLPGEAKTASNKFFEFEHMMKRKRLNFRYDRKNPRLLSSSRSTLTIHI